MPGASALCERPLVVRCGAFGDMVLLTALIRMLHAQFRCPVDIVTSGPWSEPLLRGQPGVGDVWSVRSRKTPYWLSSGQQRLVRHLRARGAGPTWYCDGSDAARPLLARAGIAEEFIVDVKNHPLLPGEHATEQWRRFAQIMPVALVALVAQSATTPNLVAPPPAELAGVAPGVVRAGVTPRAPPAQSAATPNLVAPPPAELAGVAPGVVRAGVTPRAPAAQSAATPNLVVPRLVEHSGVVPKVARAGVAPVTRELRDAELAAVTPGCYLQVGEAQRVDLERWLRGRGLASEPLILVQIGNKRTMRRGLRRLAVNHKYWPNERWAEVLRQLRLQCPDHAIVLLGTGPEYALNQEVAALANVPRLYNAAEDLTIPRLVALLARGAGLITVDSGPAHAAAAVGCPLVVLFGKALPSLYRPWGTAGADVKVLCGEVAGQPDMLGIEARSVVEAWSRLKLRARLETGLS